MRFGIGVFALAGCVVFTSWSVAAGATDCSGLLSPCISSDTFWPHAGPSRFQVVGGSDTVSAGHLGFGMVTTYLSRPIVMHLASPGPGPSALAPASPLGPVGQDAFVVNDQVNMTLLWSYGVSERLELDLAPMPFTLVESGTRLSAITGGKGLNDTAVRDLRFGLTYAIVRERFASARADFGLASRFEVSAPTGDRDQFAGERSGVFVPSLAANLHLDRFLVAAEVGLRARPVTELLGARVGSQLLGALGVGVDILPRELLSATLETWDLLTFVPQETVVLQSGAYRTAASSKGLVPAEWELSARSAPWPNRDVSLQLGGGGGLGDSMTTPRFRFTLSVRWTPSSRPRATAVATDRYR
jgi:hypothetical protein